jgi:VWFA-related protein
MMRKTCIILLFLFLVLDHPLWSQAGAPDSPFKFRVNLVVVDAQVVNRKTHQQVPALRPIDFHLFENGVRQEIASLSQDRLPLSVVFLFDLTDSVRPVLESLANGALEALQHLKPEDQAAVMVYAASATLLQDFTGDHDLVVKAIRKAARMDSPEAAFFNEAVFQAATVAAKTSPANRRVIIWLTDDVPNIPSEDIRQQYGRSVPEGSLHTEKDALALLFRTGTAVFTLLQRSSLSESSISSSLSHPIDMLYRRMFPPGSVYKFAEQSGGEVLESYSRKKIAVRMAELIDQIRIRYALGYHPSPTNETGKFHEIRLEIDPELQNREGKMFVRARRGYYR